LEKRLKWKAKGENMTAFQKIQERMRKHQFLFEELVKRDFKQKYKRTTLGMGWSLLSPLLTLVVMRLVFSQFFGRNMEHYHLSLCRQPDVFLL